MPACPPEATFWRKAIIPGIVEMQHANDLVIGRHSHHIAWPSCKLNCLCS